MGAFLTLKNGTVIEVKPIDIDALVQAGMLKVVGYDEEGQPNEFCLTSQLMYSRIRRQANESAR